jgi:formate hydrogenlyase subunit 4
MMARSIGFNLLQVLFVVAFAPLVAGVLSRLKEIVQSRRGPSIFQPYRDLRKLFHKDEVVSEQASWIFRVTPHVVFVAPIFVATLIPVLTSYPLFFAFMGDMLGGGFVLALGGFFRCRLYHSLHRSAALGDATVELLRALARAAGDRFRDAHPR